METNKTNKKSSKQVGSNNGIEIKRERAASKQVVSEQPDSRKKLHKEQNNHSTREVAKVSREVEEPVESTDEIEKMADKLVIKLVVIVGVIVVMYLGITRGNNVTSGLKEGTQVYIADSSIVKMLKGANLGCSRLSNVELNNISWGKIKDLDEIAEGYLVPLELSEGTGVMQINLLNTCSDAKKREKKTQEAVYEAIKDMCNIDSEDVKDGVEDREWKIKKLDSLGVSKYVVQCIVYNSSDEYGNVVVDIYKYSIPRAEAKLINWSNIEVEKMLKLTSMETVKEKVMLTDCGFDQTKYNWS